MKIKSFKWKSLLYIFLPLVSICLIYMISNVFAQLNLSLQEGETEAQISTVASFSLKTPVSSDPPVLYPLKLTRANNVLIDPLGNHFNGLLPTCFLLCSPDRDWDFTKAYIDQRYQDGARGFRAIWNCCWGDDPNYPCVHGGNTIFWGNEPLKERTEQVLNYLNSKGMYLVLEILDASLHLEIGEDYYAQNSAWLELFDYVVELNHEYPNLIVGTGNEPVKLPYNRDLIINWQKWAVEQLKQKASNMGDELILAVDITDPNNSGYGVPELMSDLIVYPLIDILGFTTSRFNDPSVIQITYDQLEGLSDQHPNKVIWGQEPPRREPKTGDWCSPEHKEWLRKIMFLHMGKLYTPHGLGHGEEEHKPLDWGGDGNFFWGIGNQDWSDMWNAFNIFVDTLRTIPDGKTYYNLYPDNSWFSGNGHGFSSPQPQRIFICMAYEFEISVNLPDLGFCRFCLFDPVTGIFACEYKENGAFSVSYAKDKIIYVRKANPGIITQAE